VVVVVAEFVARVFSGGKVTVPKRLRELLAVEDGNYVRLAVVEVMKHGNYVRLAVVEVMKPEGGAWVRKRVQS